MTAAKGTKPVQSRRKWKPPKDIIELKDNPEVNEVRQKFQAEAERGADKVTLSPINAGMLLAAARTEEGLGDFLRHVEWYLMLFEGIAATRDPDVLHRLATTRSVWPVFSGSSPKVLARNRAWFEKIGLGSSVEAAANARNVGIVKTPAKKWANELVALIERIRMSYACSLSNEGGESSTALFHGYLSPFLNDSFFSKLKYTQEYLMRCINLPPFAKDPVVIKAWWAIAKDLLMLNTDGRPETIDELYQIGAYNEKHHSSMKITFTRWDNANEDSLYRKGSVDSNVRAAMFKRLRTEFYSIAVNLPKSSDAGKSR